MVNQFIRPVINGVLTIIVSLLLISLLLSLVLHFTAVKESSINWFLLPAALLTLFVGGLISGYQSGTKGWYVGALTGFSFIVVTWLFTFLGLDSSISAKTLLLNGSYLLLAIIGGMIGVNLSPHRT